MIGTKKINLFGLPVYEKFRTDNSLRRRYLGGLYTEVAFFSSFEERERKVSLLGLPLWKRVRENGVFTWSAFGHIPVKSLDIQEKFEESVDALFRHYDIKRVNGQKSLIVFWGNSGEVSVLCRMYFDQLLRQIGIDNPKDEVVVLCTKRYHADILRLYYPDIRFVVGKPWALRYMTDDVELEHWRVKLCFPGKYFGMFEKIAEMGTAMNFVRYMRKYFGFEEAYELREPDRQTLEKAWERVKAKLEIDEKRAAKTVIFCMESFTSSEVPMGTWDQCRNEMIEQNLEIYVNETNPESKKFLNYVEIFALAQKAHSIVAVRSGLVDFLTPAKKPMKVFYTDFGDRGFNTHEKTASQVFAMFDLIPYAKKNGCAEGLVQKVF